MLPDAFIKPIVSWEAGRWFADEAALIADLKGFDHVFSHEVPLTVGAGLYVRDIPDVASSYVEIPVIVFPAFHPDLVYITITLRGQPSFLISPLGPYNSAIALFAYKRGLRAEEALRLYTPQVYERLGYFDMWPDSQAGLLQAGKAANLPLDDVFASWTRQGCFMHSINHAKIGPLGDVAELLLKKVGVRPACRNFRPYVPDPAQLDAIWPVYPEVAERYGIAGSTIFKRPDYAVKDGRKFLTHDDFVRESFKSFGYFPKTDMRAERVDAWLADAALSDWLFDVATSRSAAHV